MENYLPISFLNDFIFCPRSIYFHQIYGKIEKKIYYEKTQIDGLGVHQSIDNSSYTSSADILQGYSVYSSKLNLFGKIDLYDKKKKILIERKKKIKKIYDGYIYQVYAQYYCLEEMGFPVTEIKLYSYDDNKSYPIPLPSESETYLKGFFKIINDLNNFIIGDSFKANKEKCMKCIYSNLCDVALC